MVDGTAAKDGGRKEGGSCCSCSSSNMASAFYPSISLGEREESNHFQYGEMNLLRNLTQDSRLILSALPSFYYKSRCFQPATALSPPCARSLSHISSELFNLRDCFLPLFPSLSLSLPLPRAMIAAVRKMALSSSPVLLLPQCSLAHFAFLCREKCDGNRWFLWV